MVPMMPVVSMMPMMPMKAMMPAAPMHFGHLAGIILNGRGDAGVAQRQRLSALSWRGQHQQCADGGKPQNSRHAHLYPLFKSSVSRRFTATQIEKLE
jgi:hypothetical protein